MQITGINNFNFFNSTSIIQKNFSISDPYGTDWGNYEKRYTPTNRPFVQPDWNDIPTKTDKPAMSDDEFQETIKELARKDFSSGKRDHASFKSLCTKYVSPYSPDRKSIYENSMQKTGGKMNAACMFWDNKGKQSFFWHPDGFWSASFSEAELTRAREFTSIYVDELKRLQSEYGEDSFGKVSYQQIKQDLSISTEKSEVPSNKQNILDCYI